MRNIYTIKSICPASCEKNILFRYGILLPKIKNSPIKQSRIGQSIKFPLSVTEMFHLKQISAPLFHPLSMTKNRKDTIETP
jgi:hypothetical protein